MIHNSEAVTCVLDSTGWARQGSRTNQNCRPFVRVLRVTDSIYNTLLSNLFSHGHDNWHGVKIDPSLKSQQLATGWRKVLNPQLQVITSGDGLEKNLESCNWTRFSLVVSTNQRPSATLVIIPTVSFHCWC